MYRIRKTNEGYLTEKRIKYFFWYKWVHYLHYSGLPNHPYYFLSYEAALRDIIDEVKSETIINSKKIETL